MVFTIHLYILRGLERTCRKDMEW